VRPPSVVDGASPSGIELPAYAATHSVSALNGSSTSSSLSVPGDDRLCQVRPWSAERAKPCAVSRYATPGTAGLKARPCSPRRSANGFADQLLPPFADIARPT
jgi:hypothetical protein